MNLPEAAKAATNPVMSVIRTLGRIAILLTAGDLLLTWRILDLAGKAGSVDPVAVGAVGTVSAALTGVLGALGAMLVSTKIGPTAEEFAAELDKLDEGLLEPGPPEPAPVAVHIEQPEGAPPLDVAVVDTPNGD